MFSFCDRTTFLIAASILLLGLVWIKFLQEFGAHYDHLLEHREKRTNYYNLVCYSESVIQGTGASEECDRVYHLLRRRPGVDAFFLTWRSLLGDASVFVFGDTLAEILFSLLVWATILMFAWAARHASTWAQERVIPLTTPLDKYD